jgi:selenide,water dikinase
MQLGHCICNPRQPCPCDTFREQDLCHCAGERPEPSTADVRLTTLVRNAGCASKISREDLKKVLAELPPITHPRVLVSAGTCDDAGVYQLDDDTALVESVDVFAPNVDDPYVFGQIVAANALSDIYAMGGRPLTALSIIGFPIEQLSPTIMTRIIRGGIDKMEEAGVAVIGGHSINDPELKFGFAVTGVIHPSKVITNAGAEPGDVLVLTKPLGVGAISFAQQLGKASTSALAAAGQSMASLNRSAAEAMMEVGAHAATDVTGFGLLGHLGEMVTQSGVTVELFADRVPVLAEALDYLAAGLISGGVERNRESASGIVDEEGVSEALSCAFYDPQTSGGLLIAVPEAKADALLKALQDRGVAHASVVGRVVGRGEGRIRLLGGEATVVRVVTATPSCCEPTPAAPCCAAPPDVDDRGGTETRARFAEFMAAANAPGALSLREKELLAIALSVLAKCRQCVRIHLDKARALGLTEAEIDEAVWMAVAFGGAPALMFYQSARGE